MHALFSEGAYKPLVGLAVCSFVVNTHTILKMVWPRAFRVTGPRARARGRAMGYGLCSVHTSHNTGIGPGCPIFQGRLSADELTDVYMCTERFLEMVVGVTLLMIPPWDGGGT